MSFRILAAYLMLILGGTGGALLLAAQDPDPVPNLSEACATGCLGARHIVPLPAERAERFARIFRE